MRRALSAAALAGAARGVADGTFAAVTAASRLASWPDRARLVAVAAGLVALATVALAALAAGLAAALARLPARASTAAAGLLGAAGGGVAGLALFTGTGVRRLGLTPWAVALSVAAGAAAGALLWRRRDALASAYGRRGAGVALLAAAGGVYAAHATVLVRQYPLLHGLAALACVGAVVAAAARAAAWRPARAVAAVAAAGALAAVAAGRSNAARSTLRQSAPLARYPAMLVGRALRDGDGAEGRVGPVIAGPHFPLYGLDVVLVTVDALRADRLRALGGRGRTPTLDAMAERGVLFRRAYCTTPHTSYSLASLMMGTYARSVLALPGSDGRRGTLASWLGDAGYRTAGFFPPAVFAVDGGRFGALRERRFGFGTVVEGYADAPARVREVSRWLDARGAGERLFVWVHLFEPHEPYDAHPEHRYGDDREARYDAECSAADDGLRALRELFARKGRRAAWVVTADHGEEFGEHGGSFHGTTVYDEQVRVPLVVEVPGVAHRVVDAPVSLVDIVPTVLGGVGIPRPPRLRGNSLGALALGPAADTRAFASTGSLRMAATARDKLIVDLADGTLELYDLARDPGEARNLADRDPARARALRAEVAAWDASHARAEAERDPARDAGADDPPLPDALNRAVQGDVSTAGEVAALLGAGGFPVRRRAARVLGDLGVRDARIADALAGELAARDPALAREAGLSLALLRDPRGRDETLRALAEASARPTGDEALRAAVGAARLGDASAVPALSAWVTHRAGDDGLRDQAVDALRSLRSPASLPAWAALLDDPRLAPRAAEALAALGDARALAPLRASLAAQRYPITVRAILDALVTLRAPDAVDRIREGLVAVDPIADVFPLLARVREPGARVAGGAVRVRVAGARPVAVPLRGGDPAQRARGVGRVYLRVRADADARLTVAPGAEVAVAAGEREVAVDLPRRLTASSLRLSSTAPVTVLAVAAL